MIRPATLDDLPALIALGERMHAESPHFRRIAFSGDKLRETLTALIGSPAGFVWVSEIDRELAGVMVAMCMQHWCSSDLVATELALYVEPEHRGTILAARLLNRFLRWARERGSLITTAGVSTGIHVEQTARLYEAMGMRRFGVLLEAQDDVYRF